jgi:cytosine/adenosine deaminase-related metal-dependent hydrolase
MTYHNLAMDRVLRVRVPSELIEQLDHEAARMRVTRSVIARWRLTGIQPPFGGPRAGEPLADAVMAEVDALARRRSDPRLDDAA